jgi:hypothetical protein
MGQCELEIRGLLCNLDISAIPSGPIIVDKLEIRKYSPSELRKFFFGMEDEPDVHPLTERLEELSIHPWFVIRELHPFPNEIGKSLAELQMFWEMSKAPGSLYYFNRFNSLIVAFNIAFPSETPVALGPIYSHQTKGYTTILQLKSIEAPLPPCSEAGGGALYPRLPPMKLDEENMRQKKERFEQFYNLLKKKKPPDSALFVVAAAHFFHQADRVLMDSFALAIAYYVVSLEALLFKKKEYIKRERVLNMLQYVDAYTPDCHLLLEDAQKIRNDIFHGNTESFNELDKDIRKLSSEYKVPFYGFYGHEIPLFPLVVREVARRCLWGAVEWALDSKTKDELIKMLNV